MYGEEPKRFLPKASRAHKSRAWIGLGSITYCLILFLVHRVSNSTSTPRLSYRSTKTRDFDDLCNAYGQERTDVAQRIILQTNPVEIGQRRLLHNHLKTVPTKAGSGTSCMAFENVPRIEHPKAPKTAPDAMFFSLATKAVRIAHDDSICAHWMNNSNIHLLLTLPHNDDPAGEYIAEAFLSKLGLASYHINRAQEGTSYEESWAEAYPKMLQIATEQHFKVDYYSEDNPAVL